MLDLGASINVMPTSIYKSLNFGDLEPIGMTIQLANRSVVQPLGVLEDVLVQVNELIFPADFYVLDMEDETSRKGSTLILGRPFLMIAKTKIDVHVGTLSVEFGDTLVRFNIFEVMKHPTEDHSLFGIDLIDELVEECLQLDNSSEDIAGFARDIDSFDCLGSITEEVDYDQLWEVHNLFDSEDDNADLADLSQEAELLKLLDQVASRYAKSDSNPTKADSISVNRSWPQQQKAEIMSAHLVPSSIQVGQSDPKTTNDNSSSLLPHMKLKTLSIIIANNLHQEQEDKLLRFLRQHKKAIEWKLYDLPRINPSIYMHRILMEEEARPIRQKERRMNSTILDVVKKEVTKMLAVGIIYPISDS
ncbi:hypothetical protein CR513_11102, partial [Mucuna pruriens]